MGEILGGARLPNGRRGVAKRLAILAQCTIRPQNAPSRGLSWAMARRAFRPCTDREGSCELLWLGHTVLQEPRPTKDQPPFAHRLSASAASLSTVFQLRPVAGVPNFFSISLIVSLDSPIPAG